MPATTQQPDEDDEDSIYDPTSPTRTAPAEPREIILEPSEAVQHLDHHLDSEDADFKHEAPLGPAYDSDGLAEVDTLTNPSGSATSSPRRIRATDTSADAAVDVPVVPQDSWFDSDASGDVESLESSASSQPPVSGGAVATAPSVTVNGDASAPSPPTKPVAPVPRKPSGAPNVSVGGLALFTRASQTFYKAFKKTTTKKPTASAPTPAPAPPLVVKSDAAPAQAQQAEAEAQAVADELERSHARLAQLLDAQIATLNSAKTGFVALDVLKPMTEMTLRAVEGAARELLSDYGELESRAVELERATLRAEREADAELEGKEQMLIGAKVRLAEASCEVDALRHELHVLHKELQSPARVAARERGREARRREAIRLQAVGSRDARQALQGRLEEAKRGVQKDRVELARLEKGYRDIEGDWA